MQSPQLVLGILAIVVTSSGAFRGGCRARKESGEHRQDAVAWVSPANLSQQGGSVLTIQMWRAVRRDRTWRAGSGKWMAGSNFLRPYARPPGRQRRRDRRAGYPGPDCDRIRRGRQFASTATAQPYAAYKAKNVDLLAPRTTSRCSGCGTWGRGRGRRWPASIDDARIYGRALSAEQIQLAQPNEASDIKPLAWWDFEGEAVKDRMRPLYASVPGGRGESQGGTARTRWDGVSRGGQVGGRPANRRCPMLPPLVPTGPYVPDTPAWPDQPPANWMTFHLAHPGPGAAMPGDPNCIFDYKGQVHLHYIYRNAWGFVLRPRVQRRHGPLEVAQDGARAADHRPRHVQRHRVSMPRTGGRRSSTTVKAGGGT